MMMKAERIHDYGGTEVLCYEDASIPEPGPRKVRFISSKKENQRAFYAQRTRGENIFEWS